ncbi:MAG: sugar ABC transporter permease [Spirochaetales bacterium]|nr:sugar ABC transporter permease [Spirochaetales bacterium]
MKKNNGLLFCLPAIILLGMFFIYPLFNVIIMSFQNWVVLGNNTFIGFNNYINTFQDKEFWQVLGNTLIYCLIVTPMIFIPALFFAVLLKKTNKLNALLRTGIFIPYAISLVASSYIWTWILNDTYGILNFILNQFGLINEGINWLGTTWSARFMISLSVAWKTMGFSMIIILAGLSSISSSIYEATSIDGSSKIRTFFSITLPLVKPTLMLALVLSIAGSFKGYDQFVIMTGGGPMRTTEPIIMYISKVAFDYYEMGRSAAVSVVFLIILLSISYYQIKLGEYDA